MQFSKYQSFAYLFVVVSFSLCFMLNIMWAWRLSHWTTVYIAPYFLKFSVIITIASALQLLTALLVFFSSYVVDRHPKVFCSMIVISAVVMFVAITPLFMVSSRMPGNFKDTLREDMNAEVANGTKNGIINMAHKKFNCCGVVSESSCSRDYSPAINTINDPSPCESGSPLCSTGCLDVVWNDLVARYEIVGWILADISFAVSAIAPVLLLTALFREYSSVFRESRRKSLLWRKFIPKSVSSTYVKRNSATYDTMSVQVN